MTYENISLGFEWNPEMTFEQFIELNKVSDEMAWELYCKIESKYINQMYEEENS